MDADLFAPLNPRAWLDAMWLVLVESRASGAWAAMNRLDELFRWGSDRNPWRETWGRERSSQDALKAQMELAPALKREPRKRAT